jgi:hypothetical protein
MLTASPKINKPSLLQPQKAGTTFFRKPGEASFFHAGKSNAFINYPVQAKLTVSTPDDPHEKEADSVADKVMRMPDSASAQAATPITSREEKIERKEEEEVQPKKDPLLNHRISCKEDQEDKADRKLNMSLQRKPSPQSDTLFRSTADENENHSVDRKNISLHRSDIIQCSGRGPPQSSVPFQDNLAASKGAGSDLPGHTRGFMESRFNADFGKVRVHTGPNAQEMTDQVQAQAFTHGNDIYFNKDKYSPDSSGGRLLLAHELTHTIQQGASPVHHSISAKRFPHTGAGNLISLAPQANTAIRVPTDIDLSGKSGGSTLEDDARKYFKHSLKADVSDILIHTDEEAAQICRARRVPAFTQGRHICFDPSRYSPTSEEGGILLARQVADSLKQRSIIAPGTSIRFDGADKNKSAKPARSKQSSGKDDASAKDKKKTSAKEKDAKASKKKGTAEKHGRKRGADQSDGPPVKSVKPNPKKSPGSPDEDAAFQRVIGRTKTTAKKQKHHDPAESKAMDAQKASPAAPKEAESVAKERKTDGMDEAGKKDKPFDSKSFKAELLKKIEDATPKTLEDAADFKENNKVGEVKSVMSGKVAEEKKDTTGPVSDAHAQPIQVNDADNKHPLPLPPTPKGAKPEGVGAQDAAPKQKMDNEISLQEKSNSLDQEMKANDVTEDQLTKSNEPSFTAALDQKKSAQKDAAERPKQFRKDETLMLTQAKAGANEESAHAMAGMDVARGKNLGMVVQNQQTTKQKDHLTRANVAATIESKYLVAEALVTKVLDEADKESNRIFDEGSEAAKNEFENDVDRKMSAYKRERYSGFWGGLSWLEDKLFGMPDEVNVFYSDGRQKYLDRMDQVITRVANYVTSKLNDAKQAIKNAKKDIDDYVHKLPKDLADVGKQAASDIQDKFDSLEQNVNDKKDQLIEGLAKKYVDNVKKIDDRIGEMKEANAGLVDKAIGFLKKVWQVIKDLKNLFTTILSKLASIVGMILSSPGGFFDNLGKAFHKGFNNFKDKFLDYLEQGLMDWLMTNLGVSGIELPKAFSPMAIFTLVLQVLGLTKQHIKERAVALVGERKVKLLEGAGGILYRVYNEGLGAIWEMIKEKLTDLKDVVWEAIKSFIKTKIIEAAIVFLLSMLNPIGAFIKVCMAIYDFLMMLVRFKDRIMELLDSILKAVTDVASGAIDGAANAIEKAFAKSIPVIIGFLAALLHLNDIAAKVRDIITRIRTKIDKGIDFVILKADAAIGKFAEGALRLEDRGMAAVERGKQAVVGAGKKVIGSVLNWAKGILGLQQPFTTPDGVAHKIFFTEKGNTVELMLNPSPAGEYGKKIGEVKVPSNSVVNVKSAITVPLKKGGSVVNTISVPAGKSGMAVLKSHAMRIAGHLDGLIVSNMRTSTDSNTQIRDQTPDFSASLLGLSMITSYLLSSEAGGPIPVTSVPAYGGLTNGFGNSMDVKPLTKLGVPGSPPSVDSPVMSDLLLRKETPGGRTFYVAGHLLNHNIHGSGSTWENLTPIAQKTNAEHLADIESKIKEAVEKGLILHYSVKVDYAIGKKNNLVQEIEKVPNWNSNSVLHEKHRIIEAESKLPTRIICSVKQIKADGSDLPPNDPSYEAQYNLNGVKIDNSKNVHQDSLDNYYLENASAVTLKSSETLLDDAHTALKSNPELSWNTFYNSPANKLSIDKISDTKDRDSLRDIFRKNEIFDDEKGRINALMEMQNWRAFTGVRAAYNSSSLSSSPILSGEEIGTLQTNFRSRILILKGFFFLSLTNYVKNGLTDPDTAWGAFRNVQQLYPKKIEFGSGSPEIVISEQDIQNFKTTVFDERIRQLKNLSVPAN